MHSLPQWQWHYKIKIAFYRPAHYGHPPPPPSTFLDLPLMQTILVVMHTVSSEVLGSPEDILGCPLQ